MTFCTNNTETFEFEKRLHFSWQYRLFFNKSQVFKLKECTIFRIPNDVEHFRLGITLKARGTSVERNQVKRQIREFFRTHSSQLGSFDYNVLIPSHKKMGYPYPERLRKALLEQFPYVR